ncbi:MAG TPA: AAA family ATPase [Verrucomicrobiae bacterium]|nr:AAA family ATPase [Verrucomicrobiae bacterium]
MKTHIQPEQYVPKSPADFIGGAHAIARILAGKASRLLKTSNTNAKLLLYGPPGTGKTKLAEMFASKLVSHPVQIEFTNGRNVNMDVIRRWQESERFLPVFGKWSVKIVDELDTCPQAAQDLLLSYLDRMPNSIAFIGTSNLDLRQLAERFHTRLQQFKVTAPESDDITRLLKRWNVGKQHANQIAVGCGGNVRAALLDTQSILDAEAA